MVKRVLFFLLCFMILFPPMIPEFLIKGEKTYIKSYFGFVITYFNKEIKRDGLFSYRAVSYEKRGIVLKNENSQLSYIFSSDGYFLSKGEISGAIVVYFKEDESPEKYYESLKNFHSSYIFLQDSLKKFNLKPFLDLKKDLIYLENEKMYVVLGKENFKERFNNLLCLLKNENISGYLDASYDKIVILREKGKWKI